MIDDKQLDIRVGRMEYAITANAANIDRMAEQLELLTDMLLATAKKYAVKDKEVSDETK